jgi:hypothetical protein
MHDSQTNFSTFGHMATFLALHVALHALVQAQTVT